MIALFPLFAWMFVLLHIMHYFFTMGLIRLIFSYSILPNNSRVTHLTSMSRNLSASVMLLIPSWEYFVDIFATPPLSTVTNVLVRKSWRISDKGIRNHAISNVVRIWMRRPHWFLYYHYYIRKYKYVCIHIGYYVDRVMTHVVDICHSIGIVRCAYTNLMSNIKYGYVWQGYNSVSVVIGLFENVTSANLCWIVCVWVGYTILQIREYAYFALNENMGRIKLKMYYSLTVTCIRKGRCIWADSDFSFVSTTFNWNATKPISAVHDNSICSLKSILMQRAGNPEWGSFCYANVIRVMSRSRQIFCFEWCAVFYCNFHISHLNISFNYHNVPKTQIIFHYMIYMRNKCMGFGNINNLGSTIKVFLIWMYTWIR